MYNITMSFIVAAMFALAPQAQASSTPWNPTDLDASLTNPGDSGAEIFSLTDSDGNSDDFTATLYIKSSSSDAVNTFGIYDIAAMTTLEIFSKSDQPSTSLLSKSKKISWNNDTATVTNGSSATINQNQFGFYITTDNDHTYYSETRKNNNVDHLLTYNMDGQEGGLDYLLAWEASNPNFADMVVGVDDVSAVPLPAAVWFFGTALLGLVSVGRRKQIPFA